jgi:hypothetical protein
MEIKLPVITVFKSHSVESILCNAISNSAGVTGALNCY